MIGIINYGVGNLNSVFNAFERIGYDAQIIESPPQARECSHLILPGVGSFSSGMTALNKRSWLVELKAFAQSGKPLLGICLGMQLLFEQSEEHGLHQGLGFLPGKVEPLKSDGTLRIPHVGWNNLVQINKHPVVGGVKSSVDFYFVHSYHCIPSDPNHILMTCDYGGSFVAGVKCKNIVGLQFHPEKSQPAGLRVLENFAEWDGIC